VARWPSPSRRSRALRVAHDLARLLASTRGESRRSAKSIVTFALLALDAEAAGQDLARTSRVT